MKLFNFLVNGVHPSAKMSYSNHAMGSGSRTARRTFEFGRTHVVRPKGKHQATIVWLHGLGDNGSSWSQLLESLPLPNIKWICPTAPTRPVAILGGFPCTAWFDVGELSEDGPDDWEGLDSSATHIANLLSTEPADVKVGIGGFSMGAATALYSATSCALGRYGNGNPYVLNLRAVVGLSGWLPGSRCLKNKIEGSHEAARRAASLPIFLAHGTSDDVVPCKYGEKSAHTLSAAGFRYLTFKAYEGLGHYTVPKEMDEVCNWLTARLGLEGSRA
ncbi:acyl-protein thioesterase 2 isoform X4 [Carica papaya]|uniref:acyl-protein thioesterase 2 isoform X4 n=1 Tax=Carica papaya TaxID=3649 RepID=UPI000B8D0B3D|nr:acyl-protein thioesterase 2 isoform X4 [Carica papaya]